MRLCNKCKTKETRHQDQYTCKDCHNEYQKEYYKRNPTSINNSHKKRKAKLRTFIQERKNQPCADCKQKYPYYVMDFDHLGDKSFELSTAVNKMRSIDVIMKEVAKCDVVCANCHRERTFTRPH